MADSSSQYVSPVSIRDLFEPMDGETKSLCAITSLVDRSACGYVTIYIYKLINFLELVKSGKTEFQQKYFHSTIHGGYSIVWTL